MRAECCYIDPETNKDCKKEAEWVIYDGYAPDDYTHACTEHVGHLLVDEPFNHVFPIETELILGEESLELEIAK